MSNIVPSIEVNGDFTGFTLYIHFLTDPDSDAKRLRAYFLQELKGMQYFDIKIDTAAISRKIKSFYARLRKEIILLLEDILAYVDSSVVPNYFTISNVSSASFSGLNISEYTWDPLTIDYAKRKYKKGWSPFQKIAERKEFITNIEAQQSRGKVRTIEIKVGFTGVDSGKVLANEYGSVRNEQPGRPLLEPIFLPLVNGLNQQLLPALQGRMKSMTAIRAVRDLRASKPYVSWWSV